MKEGWKVVKLGDVCDIGIGKTPSRSDLSLWDKNRTTRNLWVSIADMGTATKGYISETKEYISDKAAQDIRIIPKGTILLSFKLTLGKTAIAGEDLYTNEAIANLPIKLDSLNREFLLYYFQYFNWDDYASGDEKVMGKTLNKKKLEVLPVFLPPLPEQHRIVKILDAAFEKIDAMKAKAEKNIENAKALFQQALAEELEPKEGWVEKKIKDIGEVVGGTTPNTSNKEFWNGDRCWISPAELHGEHYLYDSARKITELAVKSKNLKELPVGTVILSSRAPIGKVAINKVPMYCNQGFKCVVCGDSIYNEFLYWWFYGKTEYLNTLGTGATFLEISKTIVENIGISIPMLIEQQQIVTKLDILSTKCKKLEEAERKTITECEALKQSILKQAFNGEL